jgi:hypothetical protein
LEPICFCNPGKKRKRVKITWFATEETPLYINAMQTQCSKFQGELRTQLSTIGKKHFSFSRAPRPSLLDMEIILIAWFLMMMTTWIHIASDHSKRWQHPEATAEALPCPPPSLHR